jgi:hypothetical protein
VKISSKQGFRFFFCIPYLILLITLISSPINSFAAIISEEAIKELAEKQTTLMNSVDLGTGIVGRDVTAVGRTLTKQYDVANNLELTDGIKDKVISAYKDSGLGDFYFKQSITVILIYYKGKSVLKKIIINPQEFSPIKFELGDYLSIKGHLKSKGINLRIRPPKGWSIEEGNGPNVVKKFIKKGNTFVIITKDAATFWTRAAYREMYSDEASIRDFAESGICDGGELIDYALVTVGMYPALQIEQKCPTEIIEKKYVMNQIAWNIFYEDKVVMLMGMSMESKNMEFEELKKIYSFVAATTSFPEQFN